MKTTKKQTAVEFAVEALENFIPSGNQLVIHIILERAKEIEKQQIIDAYDSKVIETLAEEYYNETFKQL